MLTTDTKVFISYSHDAPSHEERVLALADRLRATDGIDAMIDQYQPAPSAGWQLWTEKQIDEAQFVLLICTETYHRRVRKEEAPGKGHGLGLTTVYGIVSQTGGYISARTPGTGTIIQILLPRYRQGSSPDSPTSLS